MALPSTHQAIIALLPWTSPRLVNMCLFILDLLNSTIATSILYASLSLSTTCPSLPLLYIFYELPFSIHWLLQPMSMLFFFLMQQHTSLSLSFFLLFRNLPFFAFLVWRLGCISKPLVYFPLYRMFNLSLFFYVNLNLGSFVLLVTSLPLDILYQWPMEPIISYEYVS